MRSGTPVWGPTPVTGPFKGPGLVFAAAPDAFLGDVGEKVALDPSTGAPLLREAELHGERLLAEHRGTLVTITDAQLIARSDGAVTWSLPLAGRDWDATHIANATRQHRLGADVLVIPTPTATEPDRAAHLDLRTGTLRAEPANASAALRVADPSGAVAEQLGPRWILTPRA
nr:hypothetical protein [Leucobacter chromiireducens]